MERIYAFDVDGTLTSPRVPITPDFETFFDDFSRRNTVYLITGSDRPKIEEQLPGGTMDLCQGVFTCSGAELWKGEELLYRREHTFPDGLLNAAQRFIDESPYPLRCGNHIEHRAGMVNISVVGRMATLEQRKAYHEWEKTNPERRVFVAEVLEDYPGYEASTGGEISIDIVPLGWTKAVARTEIEQRHGVCAITFFGDRMGENGNDKPLADALAGDPRHRSVAVSSFEETWSHLKEIDASA